MYKNRAAPPPMMAGAVAGSIRTGKWKDAPPSRWGAEKCNQTKPLIMLAATFHL
jgi:hypothetical protein